MNYSKTNYNDDASVESYSPFEDTGSDDSIPSNNNIVNLRDEIIAVDSDDKYKLDEEDSDIDTVLTDIPIVVHLDNQSVIDDSVVDQLSTQMEAPIMHSTPIIGQDRLEFIAHIRPNS